jgi:predicted RNA-binding protein Jag
MANVNPPSVQAYTGPGIGTKVNDQVALLNSKFEEAFANTQELLGDARDLIDELSTIEQVNTALGDITTSVTQYQAPDEPVEPDITPNYPTAPADPSLGNVGEITLSTAPTFTATTPVITTYAAPSAFTETAPTEPALTEHTLPIAPSDALPDAPTARALTLPATPSLSVINFDGIVPGALRTPPNVEFNWAEALYSSDIQTELKSKLLSLIQNLRTTGLTDAVLAQIWDKARERTNAESRRRRKAVIRQSAALGWNVPQGDEWLATRQADEQAATDSITESRNIAIAQANMEQANFQYALQQAIAMDAQLFSYHNARQQRLFEAAWRSIEAAVNVYQMEVAYFDANTRLYETQARVFAERLRAQLNEVEIYKAQLEGQRLISDLNEQDIRIYTAKIQAVVSTFELYRSKLEGVKVLLESDALKIQRFGTQIQAFAEKIKAKAVEADIFKSLNAAEEIKVNMYGQLSRAFESRMQGFKIETDAKIAKQTSDIKVAYDVPLETAKIKADIFKSIADTESQRLESLTEVLKARAQVFDAKVKGEAARVDADVQVQKNEIELLVARAGKEIEALKANISSLLAIKDMVINTVRDEAKVQAQLAAALGSAINVSLGQSENEGFHIGTNYSQNSSYHLGENWSHSLDS